MATLILRPSGDNVKEQKPSSGSTGYNLIDEATLDESDYNYVPTSVAAYNNIYTYPDHSTESGTINSVTVKSYDKAGSSDVTTSLVHTIKIGSTVYASSTIALTTSTALHSSSWTTNPGTSSAWSWSDIDALLAGCRLHYDQGGKAGSGGINYQLWVEVDYGTSSSASLLLPSYAKRFQHMLIR